MKTENSRKKKRKQVWNVKEKNSSDNVKKRIVIVIICKKNLENDHLFNFVWTDCVQRNILMFNRKFIKWIREKEANILLSSLNFKFISFEIDFNETKEFDYSKFCNIQNTKKN